MSDDNKVAAWEESYGRRENHLFWPADEVVRFVSRHLRRRVGLDEFVDLLPGTAGSRMVDIGCGIGRHLVFGTRMGFNMWGIDVSERAVAIARQWLSREAGQSADDRVAAGDIRRLPWDTAFFDHAISDSTLDSMRFDIAQAGVAEIVRVLKISGLFYCSFISDIALDVPGGEVTVDRIHEHGTIQSYFNEAKIRFLLEPHFALLHCALHRVEDALRGGQAGRWHVIGRRL